MKNNRVLLPTLIAQAVALSLISVTTFAEEAVQEKIVAQDLGVEKIVVTAQKRSQNMQDVPVAVSAMNADKLETLRLNNSTEIADQIPNVQIQKPFGDAQPVFAVRGVSMSDFSQNQSSPVALYIDEVYRGAPALQGIAMFDLQRVEVLRGPQGTLYGKNTTGGAVNFYTKKPSFSDNNGYLTLGVGNYGRIETKGAYESTLVEDVLAVRGAFTYAEADGYVDNKLAGFSDQSAVDNWAGRVSFVYTPNDDLEATFTYSKSRATPIHAGGLAANIREPYIQEGLEFLGELPGGVGLATGYDRAGLDYLDNEANYTKKREHEVENLSLSLNWYINDEHSLTSITSYDEGFLNILSDDDGSPNTILHTVITSDVSAFSQDLRISSEYDNGFNWIAGLYYSTEDLDAKNDYAIGYETAGYLQKNAFVPAAFTCISPALRICSAENDYTQERESIAAYLHTTYDITDDLTLTVGLRYSKDDAEIKNLNSRLFYYDLVSDSEMPVPLMPSFNASPTPIVNVNQKNDDSKVTGKIGLDYTLADGSLIYASYSEGYRSGAYNGQAFFDPSELNYVEPEEVDALELGLKTQFFDGRVQLNSAVFQYDYKNQQFTNIDNGVFQRLVNAEESQILGAEFELIARISKPMTMTAGLGYLDSEYKKATLSGIDIAGNELVSAPKLNFNIAINYDVITADWGKVVAHVDSVFIDKQFYDGFNTKRIQEDAYWLSNARLSFSNPDETLKVALWIKNIADKEYSPYTVSLQDKFGYDFETRGTPRTFGAEVTFAF